MLCDATTPRLTNYKLYRREGELVRLTFLYPSLSSDFGVTDFFGCSSPILLYVSERGMYPVANGVNSPDIVRINQVKSRVPGVNVRVDDVKGDVGDVALACCLVSQGFIFYLHAQKIKWNPIFIMKLCF